MQRLINTLAMSAAAVVLMAGLWQDWSLVTTLKRMLIGYLGFFFLGSLMALTIKIVPLFEQPEEPEEPVAEGKSKRPRTMA